MSYESIPAISRGAAENAFQENDAEKIILALLGLALHDPDWRYVQSLCLSYLKHEDRWIRGAAAVGLGHLARIHKQLDEYSVRPALERLINDDGMDGKAADALADMNKYLPKPH